MKYTHYAFSFVCVLLFSRCSTVYRGQVVSETTGQPLKDITIVAQNYDCAPAIVVESKTDSNGNFELVVPPILRKYIQKGALVTFYGENVQSLDYQLAKSEEGVIIKLKPKQ